MTHSRSNSPSPSADAIPDGTDAPPADRLKTAITNKDAHVGVLGLGYVGLPLLVAFANHGFSCTGFDVDESRVGRVNGGANYVEDVDDDTLRAAVEEDRLCATTDGSVARTVDVLFICVPTPIDEHNKPDTSFVESAAHAIAEHLRPGQLVVLRSTTYPNTTERLVQPILEEAADDRDMQLGRDFFLAFSPERIDPGNETYTTSNTPVVVGGVTDACTDVACTAIGQIVDQIHTVSSPSVAEMEKLLENIYRSVNIALVNELAQLCDRMKDVSVWEVVDAAATKPFGFMPFYPGPGLGGHCIPIDPHYLSWIANRYDFETSFITLSARTNEEMPYYVVNAVVKAIAQAPVQLSEARILVLGVAFKANVNDTRHSPAFEVIRQLRQKGVGCIEYSDPHVPSVHVPTEDEPIHMESVVLTEDRLESYDVAVLATGHDAFPYAQIASASNRIIDTRNAFSDVSHDQDKISLLGGGRF